MLPRRAQELVRERLGQSPAVALLGPRQCGKTTLAHALGGAYFDLEQEAERLRLDIGFDQLAGGEQLVVLDEAQTWPAIFPRLRGAIDGDRRRMGRFLLLGSVSPRLMVEVAESLAGRLALVPLTPFLLSEVTGRREVDGPPLDALWLHGGYPDGGILDGSAYPRWQRDFLTLLAQRDLPTWGLSARPLVAERLLRMVAADHGQTQNLSRLAQSLGLAVNTVASYLDHLEGAFFIRRLPAFQANIRKRLVKAPRLYVRDTGLLHALLGGPDADGLLAAPWVGASFEGFVIEQILGELSLVRPEAQAFSFRTSDRYELDLVLELGSELWALEIKLAASPSPQDIARLQKTADFIGATRRILVSRTPTVVESDRVVSANLAWVLEGLRAR